jgi:hypothetical protein
MNQTKAIMFKVIRQFDIIGGGVGVVLANVRTPIGKENYYVTELQHVKTGTPGHMFELALRVRGDAIQFPTEFIPVGAGPMEDSSKSIRLIYLSHLYHGPLHASRHQGKALSKAIITGRVEKGSFESKDVFAHPTLRLLESLHDLMYTPSLHRQLSEINYRYNRHIVYTRFSHLEDGITHLTPRQLYYFPQENLVRVNYALGGVEEDIEVKTVGDKVESISPAPVRVNIVRLYRNQGWTSLREIAGNEPDLRAFIDMFYKNGYGHPVDPAEESTNAYKKAKKQ